MLAGVVWAASHGRAACGVRTAIRAAAAAGPLVRSLLDDRAEAVLRSSDWYAIAAWLIMFLGRICLPPLVSALIDARCVA